jgi:hypothetical protein
MVLWWISGGLWWIAGFAVMVGLWVVYGGLWWIAVSGGFFFFFFFFILRCSKHCKIFFRLFSKMQTNTEKTNVFL